MQTADFLQKLGLSEKESVVYSALAGRGPCTISTVSRITGLYRPQIYAVLPQLQNRGLVSVFPKGKQRRYVAEPPSKLQGLLEATAEGLSQGMQELESLYKSQSSRPIIKYLEGPAGLKAVLTDLLHTMKRGQEYYRVTTVRSYDSLQKYLPINYKAHRDQKNLERLVITNENIAAQTKNKLDRTVKSIPPGSALFNQDINMIIYGPKVAFIDYATETAMIIENKMLADFQREFFLLLFKRL